jgi:hypothetical protein
MALKAVCPGDARPRLTTANTSDRSPRISGWVEPKAEKNFTVQQPVIGWRELLENRLAKDISLDLPVKVAPDDVFADAGSLKNLKSKVQVIVDGTGGHLSNEIRCADDITHVVDLDLASMLGLCYRADCRNHLRAS